MYEHVKYLVTTVKTLEFPHYTLVIQQTKIYGTSSFLAFLLLKISSSFSDISFPFQDSSDGLFLNSLWIQLLSRAEGLSFLVPPTCL